MFLVEVAFEVHDYIYLFDPTRCFYGGWIDLGFILSLFLKEGLGNQQYQHQAGSRGGPQHRTAEEEQGAAG